MDRSRLAFAMRLSIGQVDVEPGDRLDDPRLAHLSDDWIARASRHGMIVESQPDAPPNAASAAEPDSEPHADGDDPDGETPQKRRRASRRRD